MERTERSFENNGCPTLSNGGYLLMIQANSLVIQANWLKKTYFSYVLDSFHPFLCPRANRSHRSLLICSFLKSKGNNLFSWLLTKDRLLTNQSRRSLQMSDHERFAPVTHDKRAMGEIRSRHSWQKSYGSDLLFFTSKSLFARKTDERIAEFPTPVQMQTNFVEWLTCLLANLCSVAVWTPGGRSGWDWRQRRARGHPDPARADSLHSRVESF